MKKAEIKADLLANLEALFDPFMAGRGFGRPKGSLIYKRRLAGATQKITLVLQGHPKDRPDASAAIYPWMEVLMPPVDIILSELIGDDPLLLEGITGGISKQPIAFNSEKAHTGRWFIFKSDSYPAIFDDIRCFLERWTLPFLDAYSTPQDILAADERSDGRLLSDRAQVLRVVSAALVCGRPDWAMARVDKTFRAPSVRLRYARVFEYLGRLT